MMAKKMAGFFSVLGILVFLANWLYFIFLPEKGDMQPMSAEKAWEIGIYLAVAFFLMGLFVATLGIALVQEALAESRSKDMERRFRAKTAYDRIVNLTAIRSEESRGGEAAGGEG